MATIGLLGGTFDPPHRGHLNLALSALDTGLVSEIWFVPTSVPPHKQRQNLTPGAVRLKMTQVLALSDIRFSVCDLELGRPGPSYTIDTLRLLQELNPEYSFRLIIGADMAMTFDSWRQADEILRIAPPLVAHRPDFPLPEGFGETVPKGLSLVGRRILKDGLFAHEPFAASSSQIRVALHAGDWTVADEMLPPAVYDYVRDNDIYTCP